MNYYDDLKSNFRSWEQDCDNINDAETLFATLQSRHRDVSETELREAAYDWVGYNPMEVD